MGWGETQISGPALGWNTAWMEVRCESKGPGWKWGHKKRGTLHLQTWMRFIGNLYGSEPQIFRDGWRWDTALLEVRHEYRHQDVEVGCGSRDLDWGLMVLGRRWYKYPGIWIQVRQDLHGVETYILNQYEFEMLAGWTSDAILQTWNEVRWTSWKLDWFEIVLGWSWDATLWTCMEVESNQDGGEMHTQGPGLRHELDGEVRC